MTVNYIGENFRNVMRLHSNLELNANLPDITCKLLIREEYDNRDQIFEDELAHFHFYLTLTTILFIQGKHFLSFRVDISTNL